MPLSTLADAIYQILRHRVPNVDPSINYETLVSQLPALPPPNQGIRHHDDHRLNDALGEIGLACQAQGLPALSAIVVLNDTRVPSKGYYPTTHPHAVTTAHQMIACGHECTNASNTTYPPNL